MSEDYFTSKTKTNLEEINRLNETQSLTEVVSFNVIKKSIEKLPSKASLKTNTSSGIIFKLPYKNNFENFNKLKKKIELINEKALSPNILEIEFPISCKNTQISRIKSYKSSFIIGMKNGLLFFYDFFSKKLTEFKLNNDNIEKSSQIRSLFIDSNRKIVFTHCKNGKMIYIWNLVDKKLINYITEDEIITSMVLGTENIIYTLKDKIIIFCLKTFKKVDSFKTSKHNHIISIKYDNKTNLLYCLKKKGLFIYDMIRKLKITNISLNLKKINKHYQKYRRKKLKKFLLFIDKKRNVLIINSNISLIFIDLVKFKIIREYLFNNFVDIGYYDDFHYLFFIYNRNIKSFIFYLDYISDPIFIKYDKFDLKEEDNLKSYYCKKLNKILFFSNKKIFIFELNSMKKIPFFTISNEIKKVLIYSNKKIFFLNLQKKIKQNINQYNEETERLNQNLIIYDCFLQKEIYKFEIDINISDMILDESKDILYLSGNGIYKFDIKSYSINKIDEFSSANKINNLALDKKRKILYFCIDDYIYSKDLININKNAKKIGYNKNTLNLILDEKRNHLYTSGDILLGWDLEKREKFFIELEENYKWNLMVLDKKNNLLYVSKESKLFLWDLNNLKQLGLFTNVQSSIIGLDYHENSKLIYITTQKKIYIYGKNNKILYNVYDLEIKKALITEFVVGKDFFNYMISKTELDDGSYQYYFNQWENNLLDINIYEAIFLDIFIYKKFNKIFFLTNVDKFMRIHEKSYILREYFNFFFLAGLHNLPNVIYELFYIYSIEYPFFCHQVSPLYFSLLFRFKIFNNKIVRQLKTNGNIKFLKENEIFELFLSKDTIIHDFIENIFLKIENFDNNVPFSTLTPLKTFSILKNNSKFFSFKIYNSLINKTKSKEKKISKTSQEAYKKIKKITENWKKKSLTIKKIIKTGDYNQVGKINKYPTKFFKLSGKYNFELATPGSLIFLRSYSKSNSSKFVLSKFKYIIIHKWKKVFWFQLSIAIINWIHLILFCITLLEYDADLNLIIADFFFIFCILIFEILSIIALENEYFKDFSNYVDILNILTSSISLSTILVYKHREDISIGLRFFHVFSIILNGFRGMLFMKVFGLFRHLINMLFKVFISSLSLLCLIVCFIFVLAIAATKTSPNFTVRKKVMDYVNILVGNVVHEFPNYIEFLISIFAMFFLAIVVINFLIAKISNEYSMLEKKQNVLFYQDMATMEFEFEKLYRKFRRYIDSESKFYFFAFPVDMLKKDSEEAIGEDKNKRIIKKIRKFRNTIEKINLSNHNIHKTTNNNMQNLLNIKFIQLFELIESKNK